MHGVGKQGTNRDINRKTESRGKKCFSLFHFIEGYNIEWKIFIIMSIINVIVNERIQKTPTLSSKKLMNKLS